MATAPVLRLVASARWHDDLLRWLNSPAGTEQRRPFTASALLGAVSLWLDDALLGGDRIDEPLLPWLQRLHRAIAALQTSRSTTVVVAWERGPLELHATRVGHTDIVVTLFDRGAPGEQTLGRVALPIAVLRDALAALLDGMEEALESLPRHAVVDDMAAWLTAQRQSLRDLPLAAPLQLIDRRTVRETLEVSTTDASDRVLHTTLRNLEAALVYAGEETTHDGALTFAGTATLSLPFAGARVWEGAVLDRWREVAEACLLQPPDSPASLPGRADGEEVTATTSELCALIADHLAGIADALVQLQPLLELHPSLLAFRALALSLRRHGNGPWQRVAGAPPVQRPPVAALPSPVVRQGVPASGLRQMGYHRHWTVSAMPVGGQGGLLWGDGWLVVATARGLERTELVTGEAGWRAAGASRGGWRVAGECLFGFAGSALLRRAAHDGGSEEAPWPIPSERISAALQVRDGACLLGESGVLGRWSDRARALRWAVSTGMNGASFLAIGQRSALVVGAEGAFARVDLQRGSAGRTRTLPWAVRTAFPLQGLVWVEGYAGEAVVLACDGESQSSRVSVEGELVALWAMAEGLLGRLAVGDASWQFEVWSVSTEAVVRRCLLRMAADLVAGKNVVPLKDGILIAVRDGLIRFGVEGHRIVERWRRPLPESNGPVRLVLDPTESFVASLGETVGLRDLAEGRVLHEMGALWEEAIDARLLADGGLFVVEPGIRSGIVVHGLPSPGWLGLVR